MSWQIRHFGDIFSGLVSFSVQFYDKLNNMGSDFARAIFADEMWSRSGSQVGLFDDLVMGS